MSQHFNLPENGLLINKKLLYSAALLTALITFIVYLPALKNGFVNWDDHVYVYKNTSIRSMDLDFFRRAFTETVNANWNPLTTISFALDYALWGLEPRGYHLTNIAFHAFNTFLVSIVTLRLADAAFRPPRPAPGAGGPDEGALAASVITGLLFGLHPLHVESVAWVTERKDVLYAFFFLLSVLAYLKYAAKDPGEGRTPYMASLIFFAMSLMSKPMAVTLPAVLLILDYYPLKRPFTKGTVMGKVPFFLLSVLSTLITSWAHHAMGSLGTLEGTPLSMRMAVTFRNYIFYLYKTAFPADLAPLYLYPAKIDLLTLEYAGSFAAFLAICVFCMLEIRRHKIFSAVWVYYLITLAPVAGMVRFGSHVAADRFVYLPSLGPFILLGAGAGYLIKAYPKRQVIALIAVLAIAVSSALAYMTFKQTAVWKDMITLWTHQIKIYPVDTPFVTYYDLATEYKDRGEYAVALHYYDITIERNPGDAQAYNNRGATHLMLSNYSSAAEDFERSIKLDPGNAAAYYNLGLAYSNAGEAEKASFYFNKAASLGIKEAEQYLNN